MISTICSQTILQKSAKVFGKGPEGHKMIITTHFILGVFQNTKAQLTQKSLKKMVTKEVSMTIKLFYNI